MHVKNFYVFFASICLALFTIAIERIVGIDFSYHPDALQYVNREYFNVTDKILLNNTFFFLAYYLKYPALIVALNILLYSITNQKIYNYTKKKFRNLNLALPATLVFFMIFQLYRLHLAVHPLKDTLVIFLLVFGFCGESFIVRFISISFLPFIRFLGLMYYFVFLRVKKWMFFLLLISFFLLLVFFFVLPESIDTLLFWHVDFLETRNNAPMGGRWYDEVPKFSELGWQGSILRSFFWFIILIFGIFFVWFKTFLVVPIVYDVIIFRIWCYRFKKGSIFSLGFLSFMLFLGLWSNSFTAYLRYAVPALLLFQLAVLEFEQIK